MDYQQHTLINGDGTTVFPMLRHIQMRGSNFEIGQQMAALSIAQHRDTLARHRTAHPVYARARQNYIRQHYPVMWERMRGVAAGFGVGADDDRYDFSTLFHNIDMPPRPGCSNACYPPSRTADGHTYLSRNYEFSTGSFTDVLGIALPPEIRAQMKAMMGEPYIMEWQPTDGGYASWAVHANDLLGGAFDGMNSAGLAVALMADEDAMAGTYEPHMDSVRAVGINELQIVRMLLDTCATVDEARDLLLSVKQYYHYVPCHYMIADASGQSFIFEQSMGRNHALILDGGGETQVCTNHQLYRQQATHTDGVPELSLQNNSHWRYATLVQRIGAQQRHSTHDIRSHSAAVGIGSLFSHMERDPGFTSIAAAVNARTLWYALYDLTARRIEIDFYLDSQINAAGSYEETRSEVFHFHVPASTPVTA